MKRNIDSHKGDNGKVLVIGGSEDYVGAPLLAAKAIASLRTGVDLVTIAAPEKVAWAINTMSPDVITKKLHGSILSAEHYKVLQELTRRYDVVLIGNGIGKDKKTKAIINKIIKNVKKPLVVDADALKLIKLQDVSNCILTPHMDEMKTLIKNSFGYDFDLDKENIRKVQDKMNDMTVILLKGPVDYIISKKKLVTNSTGNPGMTVGGTGDILAGLCAGYLAQRMPLFNAAEKAAYVNGKVGDKLMKKYKYNFIASDFFSEIAKL